MSLPDPYPQDAIDCMLDPLINPSGIWADFTPVWTYWFLIENLVAHGRIPRDQLPPQPVPSDYTDYVSARTFFVPLQGWDIEQKL